jgi:hypothetical protein
MLRNPLITTYLKMKHVAIAVGPVPRIFDSIEDGRTTGALHPVFSQRQGSLPRIHDTPQASGSRRAGIL